MQRLTPLRAGGRKGFSSCYPISNEIRTPPGHFETKSKTLVAHAIMQCHATCFTCSGASGLHWDYMAGNSRTNSRDTFANDCTISTVPSHNEVQWYGSPCFWHKPCTSGWSCATSAAGG